MEQTIKITLPDDPAAPALVECSPGPYADEAKRLAAIPGSGWTEAPGLGKVLGDALDSLPKEALFNLTPAPGPVIVPKDGEAPSAFLVDRKLVIPKPRRKGRPDARDWMKAYNEAKKAGGAPAPQSEPEPEPSPEPAPAPDLEPAPDPKPAGLLSSGDVTVTTVPRTEKDGPMWSERELEEQTPNEESSGNPWGDFVF